MLELVFIIRWNRLPTMTGKPLGVGLSTLIFMGLLTFAFVQLGT